MTSARGALVAQLGPPIREANFGRKDKSFFVLKWNVKCGVDETVLYATFSEQGHVSLVLAMSQSIDSVASNLAWALRSLEESNRIAHTRADRIMVGDSLDLEKPLWDHSNMSILFIDEPFPAIAGHVNLDLSHAAGVHILQAVPIFNSEVALKNTVTPDEFRERLLAHTTYLDPQRSPLG